MAQRLQPGKPPPWIRGSIEYTEFDRNQMWLTVERITTTCWFYLVVWTKGKYFILEKRKVLPPTISKHAEQIALDLMERSLKENLPFFEDNPNAVLDVIFWMNNSPCKSCQTEIISKLQEFKTLLPATQFRFILFFSSFYMKSDSSERCLDRLNDFLENLFTCDIIVILGLLLVTRMVPKPNGIDVSAYPEKEEKKLDKFRELCKKRKDQKIIYHHEYTITAADDIDNEENETKSLLQMKSFKTPHISICRSDKLHLAQLTPKLGTENNNEEQEPEDCDMYSNEVQEGLGQEDEGISPTLLPTLSST